MVYFESMNLADLAQNDRLKLIMEDVQNLFLRQASKLEQKVVNLCGEPHPYYHCHQAMYERKRCSARVATAIFGIGFSESQARNVWKEDVHGYVSVFVEPVRGLMDQGTSVQ